METKKEGAVKGNYVSIHSSGFRDFLLKPEILRAIVDCGFEHPSEVQHECIPQVIILISLLSSKFYFILFSRPSWEWTFCARPSLVWEKPPCLFWLHSSRLSQLMDR